MIQSKGLSLQYWAEAINCANYIVNHTPTKVLQGITLEEALSKIKPDVSHFRVLVGKHGLTFRMKNGNYCSLKVKSAYLLDIQKMLNLMKISWPASLTCHVCHIWPASLIQRLCFILLPTSLTVFQL